jgi:hypothetical protein
MDRFFLQWGTVAIAFALGTQQPWAADVCISLRADQASLAGQAFDERSSSPIAPFGDTILKRPNGDRFRLAYVVQNGGNETGALIVKARHQLPATANAKNSDGFPAGDMIQLSRYEYVSPCTKQAVGFWAQKVRLEQYVDQHFYGTDYPWKKNFHADSSYREQPWLFGLGRRGICKNTYHVSTRASFLYSDNPMIASDAQSFGRQAEIAASKTGLISAAFADTAEFYRSKLHTTIIPYDRKKLPKNCVSFGFEIPKEAGSTKLEIVDSELGTRQSWEIQWKDPGQN